MKRKNLFWLIGGVLVLAAFFTGILLWQHSTDKSDSITEDKAKEIVTDKYRGTIVDMNQGDGRFTFSLKREQGTYDIVLDANSGEILSVKRTSAVEKPKEEDNKVSMLSEEEVRNKLTEKVTGTITSIEKVKSDDGHFYKAKVKDGERETVVTVNAQTGEIEKSEAVKKEEPVKRLTEEQAITIALMEVAGEIDDVELKVVEGVAYYFVEVEVEVDDDKEALVQIHAITGEVKSLTWED